MKRLINLATIIGFVLISQGKFPAACGEKNYSEKIPRCLRRGSSLASQVFAVTEQEKLTYGYDGVKWGTDLSKNKDFVTVPNKTYIQWANAVAYESPSHTNVILGEETLSVPKKVTFICIKGKLAAVSIVVKSGQNDDVPQSFFLIARYAKELYGEPTSGSIYTSNELFYKKEDVHMKIQLRTNPRRANVLIYAPKYDVYRQ